jgi:hypothetical protein
MSDRDKRLNIRVTEEEAEMLRGLAEREGLSAADVVRLFIRRAHAEATAPKKIKARR